MDRKTALAICVLLGAVAFAYSNHFRNPFHFDDSHSVIENPYIRDLGNLGLFFTDTRTFSTLPANRGYRPLVTASLAIDYALAGGLNPVYFQTSTFLWFVVQLLFMYALFRKVCDLALPDPRNRWVALFAAGLYGVHPAIPETVNYVIQRGDVYSTLGVIAALVTYAAFRRLRTYALYLVPLAFALLSKPPALIFPLILFAYLRLFERERHLSAARAAVPALLTCVGFGYLLSAMTPATFMPTEGSAYSYRITQPLIALRYFRTFFIPNRLTADTDFVAVNAIFERGAWLGFVFIIGLALAAVWCSKRREWRPTAFGLWWFLAALIPTSIFPLAEVENDHRMYFPFVGLVLAVSWPAALWLYRRQPQQRWLNVAIATLCILVVSGSVWATRRRNEVWGSDESLWFDVTVKSPRNGRGLMNYGLTQMEKGDFQRALDYFDRAAVYVPAYWSLEINRGIAHGALKHDDAAEQHFQRAMSLAPDSTESHFFYARWLKLKDRQSEAIAELERASAVNPDYMPARYLLMEIYAERGDWAKARTIAEGVLWRFPSEASAAAFLNRANAAVRRSTDLTPRVVHPRTADDYVNLSLTYYRDGKYDDCIKAAREALKLQPAYAAAYNNISAAHAEMHNWDLAIEAATQALKIRPDFQLARSNLLWAEYQRKQAGRR